MQYRGTAGPTGGNGVFTCERNKGFILKFEWVTIHKTRDIYIRHSRVPLPEIYSPLSEVFHKAYADETEVLGVEAVSALDVVVVCWIAVLPDPGNLGS